MAYKHGVYVSEQATGLLAPISGNAGLQVVIGTAPVNMAADPYNVTNTPVVANTFAEAAKALGYCDNFEDYTICGAMSAGFGLLGVAPMVFINVLDPNKHVAALAETECQINGGVAVLNETGVLLDKMVVKAGATALVAGVDYTAVFANDGTVTIALLPTSKTESATSVKVSGKMIDPSAVTVAEVVGGVDVGTGKETGIEAVRQIYPKFGMIPGILLAPKYSTDALVAAALQAKCVKLNGTFRAFCVVDIDSTNEGATKYSEVKAQKEKQGVSSENCYAVWPCCKVGDAKYYGSAVAAALMAYTDAENDDIPAVSPGNKLLPITATCLADGTDVLLDQDSANTVNGFGVGTFLKMNGFRMWGNNTAKYPNTTDPKDRWASIRRFMTWDANTFILTYFQKVDDPTNYRLIESIVDSENVRGNSFVARGICARHETVFVEEENPTTELLNGAITFHKFVSPFTPAEVIEAVVEFDPAALSAALL